MPDIVTNVLYQDIDRLQEKVKELEAENAKLRELVDGARVIVEVFQWSTPAQERWREEWLKKAEQALRRQAMNDADRKLLTEYLGERWRDKTVEDVFEWEENRDFTTRNDMMDLYEAMVRKGERKAFERYADRVWVDAEWKPHVENHFRGGKSRVLTRMEWLFNLSANPAEYEARCHMVADWIKEASHET